MAAEKSKQPATKSGKKPAGKTPKATPAGARRRWVFPAIVGAVVVILAAVIAIVAITGGDGDEGGSSTGSTAAGEQQSENSAVSAGPLQVGDPVPALSGTDLVGDGTYNLDFAAQPTLVAFWAHWCPHCQADMPKIEETFEASDGSYQVVSVATAQGARPAGANFADAEAFIRTIGLTMPTIDDPDDSLAKSWGVDAFPKLYVVDTAGKIAAVPPPTASVAEFQDALRAAG